jgi:type II secretory pathway pseudopilin PulG
MRKNYKKNGFTLVETSVTAVLLVVLGAGLLALQYILGDVQIRAFQSFTNVEGANGAMNQLDRELRTARSGDNGAFLIEAATGNAITFYSDINFDGNTDKVTYSVSGKTITKSVIAPTGYPVTYPPANAKITTVTSELQNGATPVFSYYNGNWPGDTVNNPLATPANLTAVKMIRVYMRVNAKSGDTRNDYVLDTSVSLRMVKNNL